MKIILSVTSPKIDSELDPRFGRAAHFLVVNVDTMDWQAFDNPALNASGGAGIRAAQFVTEHQCQAVISGDFGPNAFGALSAAGIGMYLYGTASSVQQVIDLFKAGKLEMLSAPTAAGHHG